MVECLRRTSPLCFIVATLGILESIAHFSNDCLFIFIYAALKVNADFVLAKMTNDLFGVRTFNIAKREF